MRWRPLAATQEPVQTQTLHVYPHVPNDVARSAALAEALARLEVATRLRDADAVARILDGLGGSDDGQWLLRQCVAAGLREVASVIAEAGAPAGAGRSSGAA